MKRFFTILILFVLTLISCKKEETTEPETFGSISGTVSEFATDSLIFKANVYTEPATSYVTTDENGKYVISNVEPGEYSVTVAKTGYDTLKAGVTVVAGKKAIADFVLHKSDSVGNEKYGKISGTVIDATTSAPIKQVTLYTTPSSVILLTDDNGAFDFARLTPATYILIAKKQGYDSLSVSVAVEAGYVSEANIALVPSDTTEPPQYAKAEGYVIDAVTGEPVNRALISGSPSFGTVFSDSAGFYIIENLAPGEYAVTVGKNFYENAEAQITVAAGETARLNFLLAPTVGNIDGTVIDSTGAPLSDVIVTTSPQTGSFLTDAGGKFAIENVPAGDITVTAEKAGYQSKSVEITVTAGLTRQVVIMLSGE